MRLLPALLATFGCGDVSLFFALPPAGDAQTSVLIVADGADMFASVIDRRTPAHVDLSLQGERQLELYDYAQSPEELQLSGHLMLAPPPNEPLPDFYLAARKARLEGSELTDWEEGGELYDRFLVPAFSLFDCLGAGGCALSGQAVDRCVIPCPEAMPPIPPAPVEPWCPDGWSEVEVGCRPDVVTRLVCGPAELQPMGAEACRPIATCAEPPPGFVTMGPGDGGLIGSGAAGPRVALEDGVYDTLLLDSPVELYARCPERVTVREIYTTVSATISGVSVTGGIYVAGAPLHLTAAEVARVQASDAKVRIQDAEVAELYVQRSVARVEDVVLADAAEHGLWCQNATVTMNRVVVERTGQEGLSLGPFCQLRAEQLRVDRAANVGVNGWHETSTATLSDTQVTAMTYDGEEPYPSGIKIRGFGDLERVWISGTDRVGLDLGGVVDGRQIRVEETAIFQEIGSIISIFDRADVDLRQVIALGDPSAIVTAEPEASLYLEDAVASAAVGCAVHTFGTAEVHRVETFGSNFGLCIGNGGNLHAYDVDVRGAALNAARIDASQGFALVERFRASDSAGIEFVDQRAEDLDERVLRDAELIGISGSMAGVAAREGNRIMMERVLVRDSEVGLVISEILELTARDVAVRNSETGIVLLGDAERMIDGIGVQECMIPLEKR